MLLTCEACLSGEPIYEAGCPGCEARAMECMNAGVSARFWEWLRREAVERAMTAAVDKLAHQIDGEMFENVKGKK
jgi:hypothetical protein